MLGWNNTKPKINVDASAKILILFQQYSNIRRNNNWISLH